MTNAQKTGAIPMSNATTTITLRAFEASQMLPSWVTLADTVEHASILGWTLCSHSDPTADGREGLTLDEAVEIGNVDPSLVYLTRSATVDR